MPDCAMCGHPLSRQRPRCYNCGACTTCCQCDEEPDTEGYDADAGTFDRDELGLDPEEDA